ALIPLTKVHVVFHAFRRATYEADEQTGSHGIQRAGMPDFAHAKEPPKLTYDVERRPARGFVDGQNERIERRRQIRRLNDQIVLATHFRGVHARREFDRTDPPYAGLPEATRPRRIEVPGPISSDAGSGQLAPVES